MTAELVRWGAIVSAGGAFAIFAHQLLQAVESGSSARAAEISEEAAKELEDLFLFIPAKKIADAGRAFAALVFFLFFIPLFSPGRPAMTVCGVALGAVAAVFALHAPAMLVEKLKQRRRKKFDLQLSETLGSMSNALRAGFSIAQSFESVAKSGIKPISQEFAVALQQMRVGVPFNEAMKAMEKRVGSDDLSLVVSAADIARKTGGNLAEIFDKIAKTVRERMRIERRISSLTAQGRLQGIVVSCMPLLLGVAMTLVKPDLMIPFLASGAGVAAIVIATVLVCAGWYFIRKIVNIDV